MSLLNKSIPYILPDIIKHLEEVISLEVPKDSEEDLTKEVLRRQGKRFVLNYLKTLMEEEEGEQ